MAKACSSAQCCRSVGRHPKGEMKVGGRGIRDCMEDRRDGDVDQCYASFKVLMNFNELIVEFATFYLEILYHIPPFR